MLELSTHNQAKIGCKYALSRWNTVKAKQSLTQLKNILKEIEEWKNINGLPDDCVPLEKFWSTYNLLCCRWELLQGNTKEAQLLVQKISHKEDMDKLDIMIRIKCET